MPAPPLDILLHSTTEEEVRTLEVDRSDPGETTRNHYAAGYVVAGKYLLERPIARGGMGQVWLARNLALDVHVAVKLIRAEIASRRASDRLLTEARAVARLGHRAIVRVFDYGTTSEGDPYLVMELIEGDRFDAVLATRKRLPAAHAVQMLLPVASALAAAHGKGIVHRDVKPDNIVLTHDDEGFIVPKLLDFGIAKLREEGRSALITDEGVTIGSPSYMAPEQALGEIDVDVRADVWGLCTVLYQATTGQRPFVGAGYRAVMDAILRAEPVPMPVLGAGDDALWAIVTRGLAKSKDARWSSMRELGRALATWLLDQGIESDSTGTSLRLQWQGEDRPSRTGEALAPLPASEPVDPWIPFDNPPEPPPSKGGRWVGPVVLVAAVLLMATVGIAFATSEKNPPRAHEVPAAAEALSDERNKVDDSDSLAGEANLDSERAEGDPTEVSAGEEDRGVAGTGSDEADSGKSTTKPPPTKPAPAKTKAPPPRPRPPAPDKSGGSLPLPAKPDF